MGLSCLHHQPVCFPVLSKVSFPGYFFGSFRCTGTVYQVLAPPAVGEQLCKDLASLVFQELRPQSESAFLRSPLPAIDCPLTVRMRGSLQAPQSQNGSLYTDVRVLRESVYDMPKCGLAHTMLTSENMGGYGALLLGLLINSWVSFN